MAEGSLRKYAIFWASPAPGSATAADPARQGRGDRILTLQGFQTTQLPLQGPSYEVG